MPLPSFIGPVGELQLSSESIPEGDAPASNFCLLFEEREEKSGMGEEDAKGGRLRQGTSKEEREWCAPLLTLLATFGGLSLGRFPDGRSNATD